MKYYIMTLGCQMNISDSQRIAKKLEDIGYKSAPEKEADLVIVNACSVRQKGIDRIWGKIRNWQKAGIINIFITGCILKTDKKKFEKKSIKIFDINELPNLEKILKISSINSIDNDYFNIEPKMGGDIAYIPIGTGCDNFCSYCAVPYTRGREISRPMKDIITEAKKALSLGYKKILLLGQNVNSYGKNVKAKSANGKTSTKSIKDNGEFIKLLKTIDNIDADFTFNFMSSNPHDMGDELIKTFAGLKKWPRELHLAMQSGDDEILKKMNRKYSSKQYLELISKLKKQMPNINITTDIIVGFPTETREHFKNTYNLCKKIGFTKAYVSQYSPRPGTLSSKMEDDISPKEKKRRWLVLNKLINK